MVPIPHPSHTKAADTSQNRASVAIASVTAAEPDVITKDPYTTTVWARIRSWSLLDIHDAAAHPSVGHSTANAAKESDVPRAPLK